MIFHPPAIYRRVIACLVGTLLLAGVGLVLAKLTARQPIAASMFWFGLGTVVSLGLALYLLYVSFALIRLQYRLDRNGLRIRWGAGTHIIPIRAIQAIIPGEVGSMPSKRWLLLPLPNWWVGTWRNVAFYAPSPRQTLVAQTNRGDIVISPQDPHAFITAWQRRRPLGPTQSWAFEIRRWPFFNLPFWSSPGAKSLVTSIVAVYLVVMAFTLTTYPSWSTNLPPDIDALGQIETNLSRAQVRQLLNISSILLTINLLLGIIWHRRERMLAYLLWGMSLLFLLVVGVAIHTLMG